MEVKFGTSRSFILLLLVLWTDFIQNGYGYDQKCPLLRLVNGRSRYRGRGRSVRFNCMRGFQLVGAKYTTCMNGKWDADVPICVKYGCRAPSVNHVNGQFIESYRGAVVKIVCNPGYSLVGSPSVYCNGIRWNETFPVCIAMNSNPSMSCDFEDPDLCGWSQDPMHDFDWKRQNGSSSTKEGGGGPPFDHTLGENGTGHYIFMENSNFKAENEVARLYSPVYHRNYTNGTCFKFWYQMYGAKAGPLKVYVKPEGVELFNVIPSFWVSGNQGRNWIQGYFQLEPKNTPFQIVVEGTVGPEHNSDTSFDDVKLASGDECIAPEEITSSTESSTYIIDDDATGAFSCKNRCNQEAIGVNPEAGDASEGKCDCHESCIQEDNCCNDYFETCQLDTSPQIEIYSTISNISSSATTPSTATTIKKLPTSKVDFNNEDNEIDPHKPIVALPKKTPVNRTLDITLKSNTPTTQTPKSVTAKPEVKIPSLKNSTGLINPNVSITSIKNFATTNSNNTNAKNSTNSAGTQKVSEKNLTTTSTSNKFQRKIIRVKLPTERKSEASILKNNSTVTSSTATTPTRFFKPSKANNVKLPFPETPSNESRFYKEKSKEPLGKEPPQAIKIDHKEEKAAGTFQGVIEVGGTSLALLVIIILGIFWYRRSRNRKSERDNMVEDSDSIIYEMDSSTLSSESHSLVCIRPGGLQHR